MYNFKTLLGMDNVAKLLSFNTSADYREACEECKGAPTFETVLSMFGLSVSQGHNVKRNNHFLNRKFEMQAFCFIR